ncbi:conjugal transfer protein TraN [Novosphingobium sp. Chol11]|uniref:conjugal transfer protein TraN n=1 Tax=Novosphingobium sp. Chol11 TaxID=1385763 RepID=UPI0025D66E6F|nr:conjugal transfer protein TraN [Novosphingobium sp. Chol11]
MLGTQTFAGGGCTDCDPVTRTVGGMSITRPCWAWERSYTCATYAAKQDCSEVAAA